jgi:SepF-like predicted cell division protein (DUF552 family)
MPFNLFRKKKEAEPETEATTPQEPQIEAQNQPAQEVTSEDAATVESTSPNEQQPATPEVEQKSETAPESASKTYLKAIPLKELADVEKVKNEVNSGNIIILRVTPLAGKNIEEVKTAVNELFQFAESVGGDIARLGEERVVICPKSIRIWREKTPAPVSSEPLPTAA